ncbi:TetR/AcrR family transcriptional regulator [Methylomonas koyamae]|uniref:HTH tetR-type domain-containing protein n=1 Tax=Methylomonas koyamae TaxID=702114 RepID=A0AA91D9Z4_9GAMM|nr:TetR/AcrR family transcriptional regulator [Methylomonas koyamae]OAI23025.1 hypothetical protein A1356_18395 [Methylomonas koyamae]
MLSSKPQKPRTGRPKAGTETERIDYLLDQALRMFIHDGFSKTSIAKISAETGVSTKTIYERYKNKAELLLASIGRMVDTDVSELSAIANLPAMTLAEGLGAMGEMLLARVMHPDMVAFYRMGVAESMHLPEINERMGNALPMRIQNVITDYLRQHAEQTALSEQSINQAAALFLEMLFAEPRNKALFGHLPTDWSAKAHVDFVVELFLNGFTGAKL